MTIGEIPCPNPNCRLPLPGNFWNTAEAATCPGCDQRVHVEVFSAHFHAAPAGRTAETILETGVSSCYHHEGKKAVTTCDGCGRFLCALCDVDLNGQHLCPTCLNLSRTQGRHINLETHRVVYDRAALSLALWPILVWPVTLLTGPAAVACGIYSFYRPGSVTGRRPWRAVCAIVIGLAQLAGWTALFIRGVT